MLEAIGVDGLSIVYLWADGTGSESDPYKSNFYAYQGGNWDVSVNNFPSFTGLTDAQLRATPIGVTGDFYPEIQPVSFSSLPSGNNTIGGITNTSFAATQSGNWNINNISGSISLPTGAATSVKQDALVALLPSSLGAKPQANSLAVTLSTDGVASGIATQIGEVQTSPTANTVLARLKAIADLFGGYLTFRNTALSSTPQQIKASSGSIYGWNIINSNTVPIYVKFFDSASPTVGTTAVARTVMIPASDGVTNGLYEIETQLAPVVDFSTAISVACVTGLADNSTTAPSIAIHISVRYK